jgi:general secretion pathway protein G
MLRNVNNAEECFENLSVSSGDAAITPPRAEVERQSRQGRFQRRLRAMRGFTLLELMIVISIILILMAVAIPVYNQSIVRSREAVLRQDLFTLRSVISQYTLDKQKAPQGLDDIVQAGYLRQIPPDPMTGQPNWEVVQEDVLLAVDQQEPGISDVHSASSGTAIDGTAYSSW